MEYRILGALEVVRDRSPIALPGRNQPVLLAVLLMGAGNPVPLSKLVDALWDDTPPATARRQIQNTISLLRNTLRDDDGRLIESIGTGYRLNIDKSMMDSVRFTEATRLSARLREAGKTDEALRVLRDGLDLWRGDAFAGLSGRVVESLATRLDDAWLAATEERIDLELTLGREAPVGELRHLLHQHPHRQHLADLLMLALYRAGRAPEALDVYTELKNRLATELGIDPGVALRERYAAILREDPALDAPAAKAGSGKATPRPAHHDPVFPVPAQLPADIAGFTGRHAQLAELDLLLESESDTGVLSTIGGSGGAGKTALAVHWAHRHRGRFPDGQLYINLRGFDTGRPVTPHEALGQFLRAMGVPANSVPADVDSAAAIYRSLLADRATLVLLDNARDIAQVRPLLPGGGDNLALVTSRNRLTGLRALDGAKSINVDTMSRDESVQVLSGLAGAERLRAEPEATERLAELCANLPLALRIAGANLADNHHIDVAEYVRELESPQRLDLLSIPGDPHAAIIATFRLSYQALPPDAQRLFCQLGLIPGEDFSAGLATAIGELTEVDGHRLLELLTSGHLIEQHRHGRYRLHDLIREYAGRQAVTTLGEAECERTADRLLRWYFDHRAEATAATEYGNVISAFRAWQHHERCLVLVPVLVRYANYGQNIDDIHEHVSTAHALAQRRGDPHGLQKTARGLSGLAWVRRDTVTAIDFGHQAVAHGLEHDGDADGMLRGNLGVMYLSHGDLHRAEPLLQQALEAAIESDAPENEIFHVLNLANLYRDKGDYATSERHLERLDVLINTVDHTLTAASVHITKAELLLCTGRYAEAHAAVAAGLQSARQVAHNRNQCLSLRLRAELRRKTGDLAAAHDDARHAADLARRHGLAGQETEALCELAVLLCGMGAVDQVRELVDALSAAAGRSTHRESQAAAIATLAIVHNSLGDHAKARDYGIRAAEAYAATPNPLRHARALSSVAEACAGLGATEDSRRHRGRAQEIFRRLGVPEATG